MATVYRRSPTGPWWGSFYKDGKRIRFSTGERNRRLAQEIADEREKEEFSPEGSDLRFIPATARFFTLKTNLRPRSVTRYKQDFVHLEKHLGNFLMENLTTTDLQRYTYERQLEGSPTGPRRELSFLSSIYSMASRWPDGPTNNPFKDFPLKELDKPEMRKVWLTRSEEDRLLAACLFPYQRLFITLAVDTGMRKAELLGLSWEEVDFEGRVIYLGGNNPLRTKTGEGRIIPLTTRAYQALVDTKAGTSSPWVFASTHTNKPRRCVAGWFSRVRKEAGLEHVRVHDLRHTFGSKSVQSGVDTPSVMYIMGHRSVRSHLRYAHASRESIRQAIRRIDTTESQ